MPPVKNYLTKSKFLSGLQCKKKLWLSVHRPELATPPSLKQHYIFDSGYEFEEIVMKRYPEGVLIEYDDLDKMVSLTNDLINDNAPVIFQAAFYHEGVYVISDIIRRTPDGNWELKEMKASLSVKDVHISDLAIQKYILENNGLYVADTYVIHLNSDGIYPDIDSIVSVEKTTPFVLNRKVRKEVEYFKVVILETEEPEVMIGEHCDNPYKCEFKEYCWRDIDKNSVLNIPRLTWKKKNSFLLDGIKNINEIPIETKLTDIQQNYVNRIINKTVSIDTKAIKEKLSELEYPLYFFDFETTQPRVPTWDGVHPHERIPFQWSCHIMDESGELTHKEYLHPEDSDPRYKLSETLINTIGEKGSVIVYNEVFEKTELRKLAEKIPEFADRLISIRNRIWDQILIFRNHYKHYKFGNYNSIKDVLPVIDPELSHQNLELSSGDEADIFWYRMLSEKDEKKKKELENSLIEYCKLDTYAMVVIHKHLVG